MDHYDIEDVTSADSYGPEDMECCDPWGDFKWWMYTEKIRQIMLDYFWQHDHSYKIHETIWFQRIGLKTIDYSVAHHLLSEVLDEIIEAHADIVAEQELVEEYLLEKDSRRDPMYRLEQAIEGAKEFGCEMDKSFYWEGMDILSQENVDEHCGDGDPSQWTY